MRRQKGLFLALLAVVALCWGASQGGAQLQEAAQLALGDNTATAAPQTATPAAGSQDYISEVQGRMRGMTAADRTAAALRAAKARAAEEGQAGAGEKSLGAAKAMPGGTPNYFGPEGNWAFSPAPTVDPLTGAVTGGLRKFVDGLPGLGAANANTRGQYLPVGNPDTITFPGSDYYEIAVVEYTEQMHADLPPTTLRGYVQLNNGTDANGQNTIAPGPPHYLGPVIVAQKDRAVRVKFTNMLPAGAGGNLFLPVDTTVMGAGMGPDGMNMYTENRATLHLHGGHSPWISDGTPHQWITPANETGTIYTRGAGQQNVPDMWFDPTTHNPVPAGTPGATNDPGPGSETFYWTNQQSARLMFYHDHSYGITRLNVYAGEAAGYVITDPAEQALVTSGAIPADQLPLIIQDKTFVDAATIAATDPTWNWGTTPPTPHTGDLWLPHVYMPNQNPADMFGANMVGRWDYGPWFWPPLTTAAGLVHDQVQIGTDAQGNPIYAPGTPNPTLVPEAFMDTPIINGCAYPTVTVEPKAYRFRVLDACNERFVNLQLYYADPLSVAVTAGGAGYSATPAVTFSGGGASTQATGTVQVSGTVTGITITNPGAGYLSPPTVTFSGGGTLTQAVAVATLTGDTVTGFTIVSGGSGYLSAPAVTLTGGGATTPATATAIITGIVTGVTVTSPGTGYTSAPSVAITDTTGTGAFAVASINTEVKMVPACPDNVPAMPARWPTDGRAGGVPDPATVGPDIIQIGTEGGLMPQAAVIPSTPIGYEYNRRNIVVLNVSTHGLFLGPAERADIVVDFSSVPSGSTLILYNDAPAPVPAFDTRNDFYTGDPDQSAMGDPATGGQTGGAPTTLPGYGPNTRTIMQIKVVGTPAAAYNVAGLQTALASAYPAAQPAPIIPETTYPAPNTAAYDTYARIQDNSVTFTPLGAERSLASITVTAGGTGYSDVPLVSITGGGGRDATAVATVTGGVITAITLVNKGFGYTSAPSVDITDPTGVGGSASAVLAITETIPMQAKAIQELFELNYGRMNATLGTELPFTSFLTQTTIPLGYIDPPTEILQDGVPQVWKITHNGVDTHAMHFHLMDVQLINRVGWDGMVKPPEPNEIGWKDTVRMNPLEDIIVALRPSMPVLPFGIPDSVRPYDVTMPEGTTGQFTNIDPFTNNPVTVFNTTTNYGWEYVWHCHLLGHEENDMMRPIIFQVPPPAPTAVTAVGGNAQATVSFNTIGTGGSAITGFTVTSNPPAKVLATGTASPITVTGLTNCTSYTFTVTATTAIGTSQASNPSNAVTPGPPPDAPTGVSAVAGDSSATVSFSAPAVTCVPISGYVVNSDPPGAITPPGALVSPITVTGLTNCTPYTFTVTAVNSAGTSPASAPSNSVIPEALPGAPTNVTAVAGSGQATVTFTAPVGSCGITSYTVIPSDPAVPPVSGAASPITVTGLANGTPYSFTVTATNAAGTGPASAPSNIVTPSGPPAAPSGLTATPSLLSALPPTVSLAWIDHATTETGFTIQRATNAGFTTGLTNFTVAANTTAYLDATVSTHRTYYYRVQAFNAVGNSAWSNTASATTLGQLPADPSNLVLVSTSRYLFFWSQTTISWKDNSTNEQGFRIERSTAGATGPWTQVATVGANTTSYTNTFLSRSTPYWYRVRAYNADGNSGYTNVLATTSAR